MKKFIQVVSLCLLTLCIFGTEAPAAQGPKPVAVEQALGGFCCDGYNYRRCVLVYATPVGNPCVCEAVVGVGHVCF